jgi:GNAT superfamily N-acetyltransferase
MVQIVDVDLGSRSELREFWLAEREAQMHGRPHAVHRMFEDLAMVAEPQPYYHHLLLAARSGDRLVGTVALSASLSDNLHLANIDVGVVPAHRRQGSGTALLDAILDWCREHGRSTVLGEVHVPFGSEPEQAEVYAFASSHGFATVHIEDHLLLPLPATPPGDVEIPGYQVVTWMDHCPDEYVAAFCAMRNQMNQDVPKGEVDMEPIVVDEERLRTLEGRTARLFHTIVSAARAVDESFAGYSRVFLPRGGTEVIQDDTLVMPGHRGRRLGTALKLATLAVVQRDHPERTAMHTWTAVENLPMQRTNREFGFTPVEHLHEMQRSI